MKVKYPGPHDGVDVEDHATGFRAPNVAKGDVIDPPDEVAKRLLDQGWEKVNDKPAARVAKEN